MRIIAGEFRGRKLDAPRGDGTRPTTDRVRESLMSALVSLRDGLDGAVVLDAFAGSGALSLEALSRGADTAVLCDCLLYTSHGKIHHRCRYSGLREGIKEGTELVKEEYGTRKHPLPLRLFRPRHRHHRRVR